MEILSIRSSQSFQFRKNQKSNSQPENYQTPARSEKHPAQFPDVDADKPDYNSISTAEIREIARKSYDNGEIDQDTYSALYEGLPMHAIDSSGQVIDLSSITETTPFDFKGYYRDQLEIAASIGDPRTRSILESVLAFLDS